MAPNVDQHVQPAAKWHEGLWIQSDLWFLLDFIYILPHFLAAMLFWAQMWAMLFFDLIDAWFTLAKENFTYVLVQSDPIISS